MKEERFLSLMFPDKSVFRWHSPCYSQNPMRNKHKWHAASVPKGLPKLGPGSAVPSGLVPVGWEFPTLKRWAILASPSGTRSWLGDRSVLCVFSGSNLGNVILTLCRTNARVRVSKIKNIVGNEIRSKH